MISSITISKQKALFLLKNDMIDSSKGILVCKDFANDDGDFVEVLPEDIESLQEDESYQHFQIWKK